jgi:hypothetical protein
MDMSVTALDVDGTLRSPLIFALVLVYAAALAVLTAMLVSFWLRGGRSRAKGLVFAVSLALACAFNVSLVRAVAAAIIAASSQAQGHVGVGFFGSHPWWLAPALGIAAGMLVSTRLHRVKAAVA